MHLLPCTKTELGLLIRFVYLVHPTAGLQSKTSIFKEICSSSFVHLFIHQTFDLHNFGRFDLPECRRATNFLKTRKTRQLMAHERI